MSTSNRQQISVDQTAQKRPTIVHAADYPAPYGGNFMASLTTLAALCQREGFRMVLALPEETRRKPCRRPGGRRLAPLLPARQGIDISICTTPSRHRFRGRGGHSPYPFHDL